MTEKLFGTDGIRGNAGDYPFDRETMAALGAILIKTLRHENIPTRILLGRDTRESGPAIEGWLAEGIRSEGGEAVSAGVLPTPGVAWLTRSQGFGAGLMVSASHNPYSDNGVKIFSSEGFKLPDSLEEVIEADLTSAPYPHPPKAPPASVLPDPGLLGLYRDYLSQTYRTFPQNKKEAPCRLVLDCAHGAASILASDLFESLGFDVTALFEHPDGRNINEGCGALHPETLARTVVEKKANLGLAFDGDADRVMFVGPSGKIYDGDAILFLLASSLAKRNALPGQRLVATVMSNLGLERALQQEGIELLRSGVGDRLVLEEMQRHGAVLGGEQSGHIILLEHSTTGDGLLVGLRVLSVLSESGENLDDALAGFQTYPQILRNIPVSSKPPLHTLPSVVKTIGRAEAALGDEGRVLVRYSGTENLCRVMLEGKSQPEIERWAGVISKAIEDSLS